MPDEPAAAGSGGGGGDDQDTGDNSAVLEIPVSALNHYLFCDRRCALIHVEGIFRDNAFTVEGKLHHEEADTPGYESHPGARVLRALPLFSRRLGLQGTADIVELRGGSNKTPYPVDYKRGRRKQWDNDDVQLCAQALCLEEMFATPVPAGAIFHATSKRRREVQFDAALRRRTEEAVRAVRDLILRGVTPPARLRPQCESCSLRPDCLPELQPEQASVWARRLFEIEEEGGGG